MPCIKCRSDEHVVANCPDLTLNDIVTEFGMRPASKPVREHSALEKVRFVLVVMFTAHALVLCIEAIAK